MDFLQIDPRMDEHPDIEAAGFDGARVFEAVLRACARNDGRGRLRGKFAHPGWLARRMNLTREVIGGMDPDTWVNHGLERCVRSGLLARDGEDLMIPGWEKFYSSKKTGAARTADWRRKSEEPVTDVTPRDACDATPSLPSQPVTCDPTPLHSTQQNDLEKKAVETSSVGRRAKRTADPPSPQGIEEPLLWLEDLRAKRFKTIAIPVPIPGFEQLWADLEHWHEGEREWIEQTYLGWCEDKWAQALRPPGAIRAFLQKEQWAKYAAPKRDPPPVCVDCGEPGQCREGEEWICYPCLAQRPDMAKRLRANTSGWGST